MTNLPHLLNKHFLRNNIVLATLFLIVGFLGFIDSTYLAIKHYTKLPPPCFLTTGCEVVTTSRFSTIGSIPLAVLGALYYLAIIFLATLFLEKRQFATLRFLSYVTSIGFFVSLYLFFIQAFILKAFCSYCLLSALTSTLLFLLGCCVIFLKRKV